MIGEKASDMILGEPPLRAELPEAFSHRHEAAD